MSYKTVWKEGRLAYERKEYRVAADKFLEAFFMAPVKWSKTRFQTFWDYFQLMNAHEAEIQLESQADTKPMERITMDEEEPVFFRAEACRRVGEIKHSNGEFDQAAFLLRKARRLNTQADSEERGRKVKPTRLGTSQQYHDWTIGRLLDARLASLENCIRNFKPTFASLAALVSDYEASPVGDPYAWDPKVLELWAQVDVGLVTTQTVVWRKAVHSLDQANKYLEVSEDARKFLEKCMAPVLSILINQQPSGIGHAERACVEESLDIAMRILAKELRIQIQRKGDSKILGVLSMLLTKTKMYYGKYTGGGLPEVRLHLMDVFYSEKGLELLAEYMCAHVTSPHFPGLDQLNHILAAIYDHMSVRCDSQSSRDHMVDVLSVCRAIMNYILASCNDDTSLEALVQGKLDEVLFPLQTIFDHLVDTHRVDTYAFYEFWRNLTLKLITSRTPVVEHFGWEQLDALISASSAHRPTARSYVVSGAGCSFCNGEYEFAGETTTDGYASFQAGIKYVRTVPGTEAGGSGKTLTLFRCLMRSRAKQQWWFICEADEDQSGKDGDIDYYQHKSFGHENSRPPTSGWITCDGGPGVDPAPTLQAIGHIAPPGDERNTPFHQLEQWADENDISFYRSVWKEGRRAYARAEYRVAADKFLEAFFMAPVKWSKTRYQTFSDYLCIMKDHDPERKFQTKADMKPMERITMDEGEPLYFRQHACVRAAFIKYKNGEFDKAAFLLRKARRLNTRADSEERARKVKHTELCNWQQAQENTIGVVLDMQLDLIDDRIRHLTTPTRAPNFPDLDAARTVAGGFKCDWCNRDLEQLERKRFQLCGRCEKAFYCSRACQRAAWNAGHEQACRMPSDIKVGDYMRLKGLKTKNDLNGTIVRVVERPGEGERWKVQVTENRFVLVTADKLDHLRPAK